MFAQGQCEVRLVCAGILIAGMLAGCGADEENASGDANQAAHAPATTAKSAKPTSSQAVPAEAESPLAGNESSVAQASPSSAGMALEFDGHGSYVSVAHFPF